MQIEAKAVARALRRVSAAHPDVGATRVVRTGIGRHAIVNALERECNHARPDLVILAGACGGLAPTDDVPRIARVIDEHGGAWAGGVGFHPRGITLIAVDRVIPTPAHKAALATRTGASIVDMESHAFAAACAAMGLPWSVVRGVSDTPDETLPAEVLGWVRPDGTTRSVRAVFDLVRRPRLIPHIIGVVRRANRVLPRVGERAAEIAAAWGATALPPAALAADDVVVFGGTFDPVHTGHTGLSASAAAHLSARASGRICTLFVPAARSPHKAAGPVAPDADRGAMLRIALDGRPDGAVWTDEIDRVAPAPAARGSAPATAPSYTVDTLHRLRVSLGLAGRAGTRLHLLLGADQVLALHRWREPREILALAQPLILLRAGAEAPDALLAGLVATGFWTEGELARLRAGIVPAALVNVSSTAVREALASGRDTTGMLDPRVRAYIDQHGLYRRA